MKHIYISRKPEAEWETGAYDQHKSVHSWFTGFTGYIPSGLLYFVFYVQMHNCQKRSKNTLKVQPDEFQLWQKSIVKNCKRISVMNFDTFHWRIRCWSYLLEACANTTLDYHVVRKWNLHPRLRQHYSRNFSTPTQN